MAWAGDSPNRTRGRRWMRIRAAILARDPICQTCEAKGRVRPSTIVDHVRPLSLGGTDDPSNLAGTCSDCHRDKTARESAEAQGRTYRHRPRFAADGWPVDD